MFSAGAVGLTMLILSLALFFVTIGLTFSSYGAFPPSKDQ